MPVVLDVGYALENKLTEDLKRTLGATLTDAHLKTVVKGAIMGPSTGLNAGGKAMSFSLSSGDDPSGLSWQCFHPMAPVLRTTARQRSAEADDQGGKSRSTGWRVTGDEDPLISLIEALISKVSAITMIERDEVEADVPLSNYSLDSLVSVELRNWIRRETGVELPLPRIVGAANLRALATHILSQREVRK